MERSHCRQKNFSPALLADLACLQFPKVREAGLKVNLEGLQGVCSGSATVKLRSDKKERKTRAG